MTENDRIIEQWALRGVVVSETARSAVLEFLPSGRQELVDVGTAVTPTLSVLEIDLDRVVLGEQGGPTTALRLAHGGQRRVLQRPLPPTLPWRRR